MFNAKLFKIIIIVLVVVIVGLSVLIYCLWRGGGSVTPLQQVEKIQPKDFEAGTIGEIVVKNEATGEEEPIVSSDMPPLISGTTGVITEIQSGQVIVRGSGTNFADSVPRTLTLIFTDETITFSRNQATSYIGEEGLKHLKIGMKILTESAENIRGKTQFTVKIVNILVR